MTKRKFLIAVLAFMSVLLITPTLSFTLFSGTLMAQAASAPSVSVNGTLLYNGYYLESNESTSYSTGATTEPTTYVAWYQDGILTLNDYNGNYISAGGDLIIKLNGKNTITAFDNGIFVSDCVNLIIDADSEATLNINVTSSNTNVSSSIESVYGISAGQGAVSKTGSVTIKGKATINIRCETSVNHAYGIYTATGFNIVGSANLSVKNISSNPQSDMSYSILSGTNKALFNTDGVVTLDNSECANRNYCISANSGIDMKKGTLICRYKPGNIYSYAVTPSIKTAPDGCVLRENPYYRGETIIKSGTGHTVTVENGMDYYEKSSAQYIAGEIVYIKATKDGLLFKGWEGEGVTFKEPKQKETTFIMPDNDVTVRAVYDVFAKQPVFERVSDSKGLLSLQLNKQAPETNQIKLIKSTGDVDVNVSFSPDPVSENFTYKSSQVWASYTPKGTYRIRVEYGGDYFYSEPFEIDYADKNPSASVSDVIVSGKKGRKITPISFDVTLSNATFKAINEDTDVSSWFYYLTGGLVAKISAVSEGTTKATITISGTPNAKATSAIYLDIPKEVLATGNDSIIMTKYNSNAKFDIVDPTSYKITVISGKAQVSETTKTNIEEGSTVTLIADTIGGYVFNKWVVVSGGAVLDDENSAITTFVMPESNVEIKATYKELPHVHSYKNVAEIPATCVNEGMKEHYKCDGCGKLFDVDKNEVTEEELIIAKNPSAHDLATAWTAMKDGHYHICKNGCTVGHDEMKSHIPDRAEATETDPVKCSECGYLISPIVGHTHHLTSVPGKDATCTEDGRKTYYSCIGCELKFKDETGMEKITDESWLVIPKAHRFGEWIEEVPATTEETGTKAHKDCEFCHKHFDEYDNEIEDLTIAKLPKSTYIVTIENGTGGGEFEVGKTVTITAGEAPEGKEFDKWVVISGDVTLTDENNATTTFVMKEGAVEIKATYKDKTPGGEDNPGTDEPGGEVTPTENKGLSSGAIIGIVTRLYSCSWLRWICGILVCY